MLRKAGWIFDVGASEEKWYQFYTYFGAPSLLSPIILFPSVANNDMFTVAHRPQVDTLGPTMGHSAYAVRALVFQYIASSFECTCSWYVPFLAALVHVA